MLTPVIVEYTEVHSSEYAERRGLAPDCWQLIVFARSEPDEVGRVYKKVIEIRQQRRLDLLKRYVSENYRGRVVKELDLTPLVQSLF